MGTRARTEEAKGERRDLLLEAARWLFSHQGYAGTTIEMITARASLSPGAFYRYFSGKLEIYRCLTALGADMLTAQLSRALAKAESRGAEARLRALAAAYLSFFRDHRDYYAILAILHLGQGDFFEDLTMVEELEARALGILGLVAGTIREGMRAGEFRRLKAQRAAAAFWGMMDGVLILEVKGSTGFVGASLDEIWATALDLGLRGLKAPEKQGAPGTPGRKQH